MKHSRFSAFVWIALMGILSQWTLLLHESYFWDDWVIAGKPFAEVMRVFEVNGVVWSGYLHGVLMQLPHFSWVYKILIVGFQIWTGWLIFLILRRLRLPENPALWVALLFTAVPFFTDRIILICFMYHLSVFLFFAGVWCVVRYLETPKIAYRGVALGLFFVSFITHSVIIFYAGVLLLLLFRTISIETDNLNVILKNYKQLIINSLQVIFIKYIDFILMPIAFWIYKSKYLVPTSLFEAEAYNSVDIKAVLKSPLSVFKSLLWSFVDLFKRTLQLFTPTDEYALTSNDHLFNVGLFFLYNLLIFSVLRKYKWELPSVKKFQLSPAMWLLLLGVGLYILGALPYTFIWKIPNFTNHYSRFQLLLPLGASLMIFAAVQGLVRPAYRVFVLTTILSGFCVFQTDTYLRYYREWFKQEAFKVEALQHDTIRAYSTFMVLDKTLDYDANEKSVTFYAYSGLLGQAFGEQSKVAIARREHFILQEKGRSIAFVLPERAMYNVKDYQLTDYQHFIILNKSSYRLTHLKTLALMGLHYTQPKVYKKYLDEILNVTTLPYDENLIKAFGGTRENSEI